MSSAVECPHCGHENDMTDADLSSNEFDWECESCEKEFEVQVEWDPTFSANEIVYETCQSCKTETREPYKKGRIFPYPEFIEQDVLCSKCWHEALRKELEVSP